MTLVADKTLSRAAIPGGAPLAAGRLPALDALRAIGAIAVVACHVGFNTGASVVGYWGGFLARFDSGVAVFFTLSGFLLFRPFAHAAAMGTQRPAVHRYLWRRALRVLPAYWVAVTAYLLFVSYGSPTTKQTWVQLLTLTQIYDSTDFGTAKFGEGLGHTWSLCTEVAFYVVLPLAAVLVLIGRWKPVRVGLLLAAIGVGTSGAWMVALNIGLIDNSPHSLWLPSYACWFAAGMILATAHVALATGTAPKSFKLLDEIGAAPFACFIIAFATLAVATTPLAGPRDLSPITAAEFAAKVALYTVVAAMLLIPLAFGHRDRYTRVLSSRPARWLGTISYGLFLWHPLVIAFIYRPGGRVTFTGDPVGTFLIVLGAGIVLATLSYYLVEWPFQLLANFRRRGAHRPGHG